MRRLASPSLSFPGGPQAAEPGSPKQRSVSGQAWRSPVHTLAGTLPSPPQIFGLAGGPVPS